MKTLDDFMKEYSPLNNRFDKVDFRRGARITNPFGLTEGYTMVDGELVFDTVELHTGVDRSAIYGNQGQCIENLVICPFNFTRSNIIYYKPKESYGTLIQLFNDDYGFEMRIAHMDPNRDIVPEVKALLEAKQPIARGTVLGKAGNYGQSGGAHTHAEFISLDSSCKVFDDLLGRLYNPEQVFVEYSKMDILKIYQPKAKWVGKTADEIFAHYESLKKIRFATFVNKYFYSYIDQTTKKARTRYSSELLFNGL